MGSSVARFFLAGQTAPRVLEAANLYGASVDMRVDSRSPNQVRLVVGSIWVTGQRVLTVSAWEAQGGANVQVEAYVKGLTEFNANPRTFVGRFPRRDMWRIASAFVASLGVNPDVVFVHA